MPIRFESLERLTRQDPSLRFRSDDQLGIVCHLRGHLGEAGREPERAARSFLSEHHDLFGAIDYEALAIRDAEADPAGGVNVVFEQRHAGYRVLGGSVRFHIAPDGQLDTVSNRLFPDLGEVPRRPEIDSERAVAALRETTRSRAGLQTEPEPVVVRHAARPYLAWEIRFDLDHDQHGDWGEPMQLVGYVDTASGSVLYHYNNVQTAGAVVGSGTGVYSGPGPLNTWFTDTTYELRDTTRTSGGGPEIRTNDEDGTSPSSDSDDNWNTLSSSPRDANQGAEVDAHRYAGKVADYFRTVHGRQSFDGAGATMTNLVHLGTNYNNGYWDGSKVNLGDGSGSAPGDNYETADDWLAHEWTHAYTQYTCGLQYYAESGALNEAFSDIFAAFIAGDWLVFEDSWLKASAPASRNMIDPTNGGQWNNADPVNSVLAGHQPSHYTVRYTGTWDNAGVHINSGIINNLFYLLTVGGTHAVSGVAVSGIGQSAAERMLWRCMTINLVGNPTATFLQFREAMLDACLDLFPGDLFKLAQVKAAFNAVGVGPDSYVRDNLGDTGTEPYTGGYLWASPDIINRTAPSANPSADFADLGDDALWQNVEFGQDNFIYIRLQNRGPADGDATVNVFFSPATTFGTPAAWQHIGTLTATAITSGGMQVLGPLTFDSTLIPAVGHYCMIAVVSSSLDPAPDHTLINTVTEYLDYVRGTNNIAYRNLDVVDLVPGMPGTLEFIVRGIEHDVADYSLRFDDAMFVPGAKLRIAGPAKVLRAALPRGLKLRTVGQDEAVFELPVGKLRRRWFDFGGRDAGLRPDQPGFDRLRLPGEIKLRVEYELPEERLIKELPRPNLRRPFTLAVRQYWRREAVGGMSIRMRSHPK